MPAQQIREEADGLAVMNADHLLLGWVLLEQPE
jgi:hypothetical protein